VHRKPEFFGNDIGQRQTVERPGEKRRLFCAYSTGNVAEEISLKNADVWVVFMGCRKLARWRVFEGCRLSCFSLMERLFFSE
jgi:hypothetical protein